MSVGTLNGHVLTRLRVQVSAWGAWWADAELVEAVALTGAAALSLAGTAMVGTIVSGGVSDSAKDASYRIVGGAGGWGKILPAKSYASDAGVKLSTVLGDAAREAGETLGALPTTRLGPHYARANGPACAVLNELAPRGWYIDFAGITQIGARASSTYAGAGVRVRENPAGRVIELAVEDIAGLVPGVIVDGAAPATDVEYVLDAKRLTARVYAGSRTTRRLDALARVIDALDPSARYRGVYEYRVVTQEGERLNLQPVRAATGLPDLARVPMRPGMSGMRATVQLGELVLVAFVDADPSRPVVIAHDAPDAPGYAPSRLDLVGVNDTGVTPTGAVGRVVRFGDPVVVGTASGTITITGTASLSRVRG